jgi:hypothetical protein
MKKLRNIIVALLFILTFSVSCDDEATIKIKALKIGDKFTSQNYRKIDVARADDDVVIYRRWTWSRYYYYSTTRKDSIIYKIRSVVRNK